MGIAELILVLHSFTRWLVLITSVGTALAGLSGAVARRAFGARDRVLGRLFVASVDVQVLLGLSLYFGVSPLARAARALWASGGLGTLWAAPELRFFGIIHPALVLLAAGVAHTGWVAARRAEHSHERHRRLAAGAALALAIFLAAIPWPFLGHERPWFRF